jgi:hypothetical protein
MEFDKWYDRQTGQQDMEKQSVPPQLPQDVASQATPQVLPNAPASDIMSLGEDAFTKAMHGITSYDVSSNAKRLKLAEDVLDQMGVERFEKDASGAFILDANGKIR